MADQPNRADITVIDAPGSSDEGLIKQRYTEVSTSQSRFWAVSGIIFSSSLMAIASGLLFAYIPVRLLNTGFEPWVASSMTPAVALGGLFGCFATGPLLRLVGHARVFMLLYALIIISVLALAAFDHPLAWLCARLLYGFGINGLFIVAQSWLHHASTDEIRGRVITIFYIGYVVSLGGGSFTAGYMDNTTNSIPILGAFFVAIAMIPIGLTRLPQPEPPDTLSVNIPRVWRISPVGLAGMFAVGGATMLMQTMAPIYTTAQGYGPKDVGLVMLLMQIGLVAIQMPMGALSDRIDRRIVLAMVSAGSVLVAALAFSTHGAASLFLLIVVFALWNGFNETVYSVSSALANDRADPKDYVMLSSTQMIAWSIAAFIIPSIATVVLAFVPIQYFIPVGGTISAIFLVFVLYRMSVRDEVPQEEREEFQTVTAQVAYPGDYSNPDAYEDEDKHAGKSEGLVN